MILIDFLAVFLAALLGVFKIDLLGVFLDDDLDFIGVLVVRSQIS